ncbi:MAG: DNA-deoxyinosine glycosylase [Eubacteriales bacterium]|nr:DNA-deoxyinosine glycosylase [Eubacteriales bacterium]
MADYTHIQRTFGPVYDENSRILILGSFPSVKSREANFYYGHPQNRFWPLLSRLLECDVPESIEEKKTLLLSNNIALWDTLDSCDIIGSSDSSIRNAVPTDVMQILDAADIKKIFCNGGTSYTLFLRYLTPVCGITPVKLPSTSPANASWNMERLYTEWIRIKEFL